MAIVAAQRLERMASLSILVSAGILLSAIGFAQPSLIGAALFYLVSSTLALSALFLLAELIERSRSANEIPLEDEDDACCHGRWNRCIRPRASTWTTSRKPVVGQVIPWTMAFLGLSFIACALLIIGMPPLSGFIGKLSLLSALFNPMGLGNGGRRAVSNAAWGLVALLILPGMASLIAFGARRHPAFLDAGGRAHRRCCGGFECVSIFVLLGLCIALSVPGRAAVCATPGGRCQCLETTRSNT